MIFYVIYFFSRYFVLLSFIVIYQLINQIKLYGKGNFMSNDAEQKTSSEVVPFSELQQTPVDLNVAIEQANQMHILLSKMRITKAVFETGTHYQNDGNSVIVAGDGLIVEKKEHTTTVSFLNPGSSLTDAIPEISENHTQTITGAFSNVSQSTVSNLLSVPED